MAKNAFNLDFEKPIVELQRQIGALRKMADDRQLDVGGEIIPLEAKLVDLRREIYRKLTPMQRVQVARHPQRPFTLDYISRVFTEFVVELPDAARPGPPPTGGGDGAGRVY